MDTQQRDAATWSQSSADAANQQSGLQLKTTQIFGILLVIGTVLIAGMIGSFFIGKSIGQQSQSSPPLPLSSVDPEVQIACPTDAQLCPDGSYISREEPNCEFPRCPEHLLETTTTPDGLHFSFPSSWNLSIAPAEFQTTTLTIHEAPLRTIDRGGESVLVPDSPRDPEKYARISIVVVQDDSVSIEQMAQSWRGGAQGTKILLGNHEVSVVESSPSTEGEPLVQGGKVVSMILKLATNQYVLVQLETANVEDYRPIVEQVVASMSFR